MQIKKGDLTDLFTDTAAILNVIVSNRYYGKLRGIHMGLFILTAVYLHKKCSTLCEVHLRHSVCLLWLNLSSSVTVTRRMSLYPKNYFFVKHRWAKVKPSRTQSFTRCTRVKLASNIRYNEQTTRNRACSLNRFVLYLGFKPVARVGSASTLISCSLARTNRYSPSRSPISSTVTFRRGLPEWPG